MQLKRRILKVAEEAGYKPHPYFSTLMKQVSRGRRVRTRVNLAWIQYGRISFKEDFKMPWGWYPAYSAALKRVRELGYENLEPYWCESTGTPARHLRRILKNRGILGALVAAGTEPLPQLGEFSDITLVKLTAPLMTSLNHHVYSDIYQGVLLACSQLWQAGYRRIGLLSGITHNRTLVGRNEAAWQDFQGAVPEDLKIPPLVDDILSAHIFDRHFANQELGGHMRPPVFLEKEDWKERLSDLRKAYSRGEVSEAQVKDIINTNIIERWLDQYRPDVILCQDSRIVNLLVQLGYRVPHDMGVAHLNLSAEVKSWSGVNQHREKIGVLAIDTLDHLIGMGQIGQTEYPVLRTVSGMWSEGETTRYHAPPVYADDHYVNEWIEVRGNIQG